MVKLVGEEIAVKAEILRIDSFSSHADEPHLCEWVKKTDPGVRIFINHGEDAVTEKFAAEVAAATGKPAVAPYSGEVWDLATDELIQRAEIVPVVKKTVHEGRTDHVTDHRFEQYASPALRELRRSGAELTQLIEASRECSNKELNKMRREIEEIIKKYGPQEGTDGQ